MFDEQGDQIFAATDVIAERARKVGGMTIRSIGQISRLQRLLDNDAATRNVGPGSCLRPGELTMVKRPVAGSRLLDV